MIHLAYSNDMRGGGLKYLPSRSISKPYEPTMAQLEHTIILVMNDATWPVAVIHPVSGIGSPITAQNCLFRSNRVAENSQKLNCYNIHYRLMLLVMSNVLCKIESIYISMT